MWAVEALAWLEARDVLIEYLQAPSRVADPQVLFAEDAVEESFYYDDRAIRGGRGPEMDGWMDDCKCTVGTVAICCSWRTRPMRLANPS
jgi:hypothetical protein